MTPQQPQPLQFHFPMSQSPHQMFSSVNAPIHSNSIIDNNADEFAATQHQNQPSFSLPTDPQVFVFPQPPSMFPSMPNFHGQQQTQGEPIEFGNNHNYYFSSQPDLPSTQQFLPQQPNQDTMGVNSRRVFKKLISQLFSNRKIFPSGVIF